MNGIISWPIEKRLRFLVFTWWIRTYLGEVYNDGSHSFTCYYADDLESGLKRVKILNGEIPEKTREYYS